MGRVCIDAAKLYNDTLKESSFNYNLKYSKTPDQNAETETKKNRTEKGKSYGLIHLFLKM